MDFDQLLIRFLGTTDLATLSQDQILAGVEALRDQLEVEADAGDRLSIWCLLYMLGAAPDPDEAFESAGDRAAARDFAASVDEDDDED
ncbi:hypothetical protein [Sphingomonas sp. MMS24-J13]|uniref:hypothetical protein n=1 Tax=Sphingomonas sp. MMS24-J13 TaxID=3238686 RepID=UPI00384FCD8E